MHFGKKHIKSILSVVVCFSIFFVSGCSVLSGFDSVGIDSYINFAGKESSFRVAKKSNMEKAFSTDSTSLYFDKGSGAVMLSDTETSFAWNSLPDFLNDFAAAFLVKVLYEDKIIELDSSYNAAKLGKIEFLQIESGIKAVYEFVYEDLRLKMPVDFILRGAYLNVTIDVNTVECESDIKLLSVACLPYMGAIRYDSENIDYDSLGDYFLVPDGVGGLMHTALENEAARKTYSVYSKQCNEDVLNAAVGAFGIKQGNKALAVTLTDGVENAFIRVVRSNADNRNINMIYPEFIVTPVSGQEGKILTGIPYQGKIGVCYDVTANEDADYNGIAVSVRQALVNADILSAAATGNVYPFFVSVTGTFDGSRNELMTSFGQAEDLLNVLKSKGINNINLILEGAFASGVVQDASYGLYLAGAAGGKKDFDLLCSYASMQKLNIFIGVNYLTSGKPNANAKRNDGTVAERTVNNPFYPVSGDEKTVTRFIASDKLSSSSKKLVEFQKKYNIAGFCLFDANGLAIDNSGEYGAYTDFNNALVSNLGALSAQTELMLSGISLNTVRNSDYVKNFPLYCESEDDYLTAVPFLPIVLHGSLVYSGNAANSYAVPRMHLLKSIEYGAVPYFSWVYNENSVYYYENTLNEAVDFYVKAVKELGGLSDKRITDHFMYENGVYCTCFEGGVRVYVNYNNYSVIIGEVSVMPYDYLRIG